jgi:hypothetical protein
METELKKLPKFGEGKEAQTSPQYLERAIESARKEISRTSKQSDRGDSLPMPDITVHYFSKDSEGRASMPWKVRIWK